MFYLLQTPCVTGVGHSKCGAATDEYRTRVLPGGLQIGLQVGSFISEISRQAEEIVTCKRETTSIFWQI